MTILTDILGLIKRGVFTKTVNPEDVILIGVNEQSNMTGVASPVPYKTVKLIKIKDLKIIPAFCNNENTFQDLDLGIIGVFKNQIINPITNVCTNYFKSLRSLSPNINIQESMDGDFIEITTTGEPNLANNLGPGTGIFANKTGETLNFKSLKGKGVLITQTADQVILNHATKVILNSLDGASWEITVDSSGVLQTVLVG